MAELAGHGHRALLVQHLTYLVLTERPQKTRYPALGAAAFETYRRAAKEPQVATRKALRQELLDAVLAQAARSERSRPRGREQARGPRSFVRWSGMPAGLR